MKNNLPPPPPRRGGAASSSSGGGYTATTAPSTSASPYYSLSEIDDDSTAAASASQQQQEAHNNNNYNGGDDTTEIDDNDSILEMAKRLDAASVISDPSFIEGPHTTNEHYPSSRGAFNRMDDIASEEEDEDDESSSSDSDDSSSSSSDSSTSSDGQYHHHHRERYDYNKSRSRESSNNRGVRYGTNNSRNYPEEGMRSHTNKHHHHRGGGGGNNGRSSDRRRRDHPRQPQQSSSMPSSQPYYDNSYDGRGQHNNNNNNNMSYPGAGERKYSPPRGVVGPTPIDPIMYTSNISNNNNNNNGISKKQSRGGFRIDDPRSSSSSNKNSSAYDKQTVAAYEKKQKQERYYDREDTESAKRRRTKMILIPTVVILIIGVVVAVAVVVGKGTGNDGTTTTTTNNDNSSAFQPIPVPTTSPTYVGLYQCSFGKSGITVTKGCLGFIECSESGTPRGAIQYCTQGTLYDVQKGVCDFADNVVCSTSLPTQEDFAAGAVPPTTGGGGVVGVVPPAQNPPSITVGPITTLDHKLLFEGILNPGQLDNNAMNRIAKNLEAYLNIFYSARVVSAYNNGDYVLESISNVAIEVTPTKFEFVQSNRRNLRRDLQTVAIQANGFAMTYQQSTKYDTIDRAITVGDIVRLPYQERYQDRIVSYLKAADPVFSSLTRTLFVEGEIGGQPQPAPVPVSNPPPPTRKPTIAPTKQGTVAATNPDSSPSYMIQGLIFFDENQNGKFENETEKTFEGVWANLKLCTKNADGNDWVNTGASEAKGLYKFDDVKENEYFIEFFKPRPGDDYNFTAPQVAGTDDSVLDSDVIGFTKNGGKTGCFTVGPGFDSTKYINAGYKLKATPPPSPAPSKSPTQSPIDVSYYCADVTTTSAGTQTFNFLGCQIRCGNGFIECPGNTRCVFADVCIEPV